MRASLQSFLVQNRLRMAAYFRVSDKHQEVAMQEVVVRRRLHEHDLPYPDSALIYGEKASAFRKGGLEKRIQLQRLLDDIRSGVLAGAYFYALDRYFRKVLGGLALIEELRKFNAVLVVCDEWKDIVDPVNEEWLLDRLVDAQKFSMRHSKRVSDGKYARAMRGETNAAEPVFGYVKDEDGKPVLTEDADYLRRIASLYETGRYSYAQVALEVSDAEHTFTEQDIARWLRNPFIAGLVQYKKDILPGNHQGAITPEQFKNIEQVRRRRAHGGRGVHYREKVYVFGDSLLSCVHCSGGLHGQERTYRDGTRVLCYMCRRYKLYGPESSHSCISKAQAINEADLEAQFRSMLGSFDVPDEWLLVALRKAREIVDVPRPKPKPRISLQTEREQLAQEVVAKRITVQEFLKQLAALDEREAQELGAQVELREAPKPLTQERVNTLATYLRDLPDLWDVGDSRARQTIVKNIAGNIEADAVTKKLVRLHVWPDVAAVLRGSKALTEVAPDVFAFGRQV